MDELQAGFLRAKLPNLDADNARRKEIALIYKEGLAGLALHLPTVPAWADPAWHLYVVRTNQRESFRHKLEALGVETLIHYPIPPHLQAAYTQTGLKKKYQIAETMAVEVISLPMGPHLSDEEVLAVIQAVSVCL